MAKHWFLILTFIFALPAARGEGGFEKTGHAFAFSLYGILKKNHATFLFSPASLTGNLTALYTGAEGETAAQLKTALQTSLPPEAAAPAFASWKKTVIADAGESGITMAAALFPQAGYAFKPEAIRLLRESACAELIPVDYATPAARTAIAAWIARQTKNRIAVALPPAPDTVLSVVDAVSFNGRWAFYFAPELTRLRSFFITPEHAVSRTFMSAKSDFPAALVNGAHVIELPYRGGSCAMLVALPSDRTAGALDRLEETLCAETFAAWRAALKEAPLTLRLPRFRLRHRFAAIPPLRELGVTEAFLSGKADFSRFCASALFVSSIDQQVFVDVTERGTFAAAATQAAISFGGMAETVFTVDRPFLFFIIEKKSGAILFMGRVTDPG